MGKGFKDTGVFVLEEVFYFLLWVTTRHGNRPTELIIKKERLFMVSDVGCYSEMDNTN